MSKTFRIGWKRTLSAILQFIVILLVVGWMAYILNVRGHPTIQDKNAWTRRDGFVALSFAGISRRPSSHLLPREGLKKHLEALHNAGFQTISTENLLNFYYHREPLPDKPLYLMFEGGRKDGAIYGQEALSQTGMRATMFVYPRKMDEWSRTFLSRSEVATLSDNAFWEVGAMPYDLYLPNTENSERPEYYLAEYLHDANGKPTETPAQFALRAEKDYAASQSLLAKVIGKEVPAYIFYPANSLGNTQPDAMDYLNNQFLEKYFRLAFTREGLAFNSRASNPRQLTRLLVTPNMEPGDLVRILGAGLASEGSYLYQGDSDSDRRWQAISGRVDYQPDAVVFRPETDQFSLAWLIGSEDWGDVDVQAGFSNRPGDEVNLYLRFNSRQSYLRLHLAGGVLMLQERTPGQGISTLASFPVGAEDEVLNLRLTAKKNRLWVGLEGAPLTDGPLPFPAGLANGRVAVEARTTGGGENAVRLVMPRVTPLSSLIRLGDVDEPVSLAWPEIDSPAGLLLRLPPEPPADAAKELGDHHNRIASYLLRVLGQGMDVYAWLPPGECDPTAATAVTADMPQILGKRLWSGVAFTYQEPQSASDQAVAAYRERLAAASERARGDGWVSLMAMGMGTAAELAGKRALPPGDVVLLKGEGTLSEAVMRALKRNYRQVLFWQDALQGYGVE